ncbi:TPA: tyrosine-type recombinase/integrase [Pseudomonas putida]|uniref:tyrosine-type recombinase/integrase n=1 Tax=Pseudomonas sp. TaxID=306 RepID=UPI0028AC19A1|nr:site-specific integrase [Pseudomonas sp.]
MSATVAVKLSDAEIRRQAAELGVRDLRDPRHPGLRFRFDQNRQAGTWFLVIRRKWNRLARFPEYGPAAIFAELPGLRQRLLVRPNEPVALAGLVTFNDLLAWYKERATSDASLSDSWKSTVRTVVDKHLLPRLGDLPILALTAAVLDKTLMWPLQAECSTSYVRQIFRVLSLAVSKARALGLIPSNPMAELKFTTFIKTKIAPKDGRLRADHLQEVVPALGALFNTTPVDAMLALLMICHGTRVGESRRAEWPDFAFGHGEWIIPAKHTKTRTEHRLPLTPQVCALLRRYRAAQLEGGYTGKYLFPGRKGQSMSASQAASVFRRLACREWSSHDLRKVARTAWLDMGVDGFIGEMLLNHSLGKVADTYIKSKGNSLRREALEQWHEWLDGIGFAAIHGLTGVQSAVPHQGPQAKPRKARSPINELVTGENAEREKGPAGWL